MIAQNDPRYKIARTLADDLKEDVVQQAFELVAFLGIEASLSNYSGDMYPQAPEVCEDILGNQETREFLLALVGSESHVTIRLMDSLRIEYMRRINKRGSSINDFAPLLRARVSRLSIGAGIETPSLGALLD